MQTLAHSAAAKGVTVEVKAEPALGEVLIDSTRFEQVIWNLVGNAIKFTPSGGRVTVTAVREGEEVVLAVADTGDGISPDFMPSLFTRFGQAQRGSRRSTSGLGLGLSIARHLVELHGGTMAATSPGPGKGSTFTVRLPLRVLPALRTGAAESHFQEPGRLLKGRKVLLVENDASLRRVLTVVLEAAEAYRRRRFCIGGAWKNSIRARPT